MKRTRRIEITRYRRVTSQDEPSATEPTEERPDEDLILNLLQSLPPMSEDVDSNAVVLKDIESESLPQRSLLKLARLLRPRKRT